MNIFPLYLDGKPFIQNLYLLRRHDRYLSAYAEDFIELLCDCLAEVEEKRMERAG